jgi:hypothetical protein
MTDDEIVSGYVKHLDREQGDHFWAWEAITDLIDRDPEHAWRLVVAALSRCKPGHEQFVGAGPLKELLIKHPRQFAERVARQLHDDARFAAAFRVIRLSLEYATSEDADYFTRTLEILGVAPELQPRWMLGALGRTR